MARKWKIEFDFGPILKQLHWLMQHKHNAYVVGINFALLLLYVRSIWFVHCVRKNLNNPMELVTPKLMYACENEPHFLLLLLAIMEMEDDSSELTLAVSTEKKPDTSYGKK